MPPRAPAPAPDTPPAPAPAEPLPDRYAHAVRARRVELRAARDGLTGAHRELRSALTAARLAAATELADATARLAVEAREHLRGCDRRDRARFPALFLDGAERLRAGAAGRREGTVRAAARRVAARRGLTVDAAWPELADGAVRPLRTSGAEPGGAAWPSIVGGWRAAVLPAASLPLVGLSVASPGAVAATAVLGVGAAVLVGGQQSATTERSRLRRWCDEVLLTVRADGDAAFARLVLRVEQGCGALDVAVAARRAEIAAELDALAPEAAR